jgi:xylulokinase
MPLVAGVDSSTGSATVQVRDADSGILRWEGSNAHPPTTPPRAEQDPQVWWKALRPLLDAAWTATGGIAAVSVAAQQHGMVVLDDQRTVIRPAKLWHDTEAARDAAELVGRFGGPARWADATGSVPGPAFTIAKLAWLRRVEPDAHARIASVLLPHDWLTLRLSGELVTDRGDASGTGYFSPTSGRWLPEVLELVGLGPETLPRVLGPTERAAERGFVVAPGTGDNMATALGVALAPGDVAFSLGTSGTVFAVTTRPCSDPTGAVAGFADAAGRYLPLVCTLNATKVTDTVARLLGVDHEAFARLALTAPAGAGGMVLVPYLDGERTPPMPGASGVLSGVRSDASREQLARAAVEGVVCALLEGLDALATAGVPTGSGSVVLVGGGARSPAYRRVLCDLLGRPLRVPADADRSATGACVQAAAVLHGREPGEVARAWALGTGHLVEPDPRVDAAAVRAAYAEARRRAVGA